jgi:predicted enzyme related to lactoylglutathione lyase
MAKAVALVQHERRPRTGRGGSIGVIIVRIRSRWEAVVRPISVIANLRVANIEASRSFYADFLGLSTEEFNLGWVARFTSPDTGASVQLVTGDATSPEDSNISVMTADVEAAYQEAQRLGYDIVHPLTTEPWGVRRFLVRAPDGTIVNIVRHRD